MATITVKGSSIGTAFELMLMADDISAGSQPSYELCKQIYLFHPLGAKIAEKPIEIAMSQKRDIEVPDSPGDRVKEAFEKEWKLIGADDVIFNVMSQSRVYGIASLAVLTDGVRNEQPLDFAKLHKQSISFNVYDPLNTAGSLVLDQNPLSMKFQNVTEIRVNGSTFHKSRTCVMMNEKPMYIVFQSSTYGFTGRSVYQRALLPLKSFVQTMITDDMVSVKAGVLVAKIQQAGSFITEMMQTALGLKRNVVKEAMVGNVISVGSDGDSIESIDLKNLAEPFKLARHNIIENTASAVPMPAKMLTEESFAEGFGEGTEDARAQARYVDRIREKMDPLFMLMDKIVQHRAWSPEFVETIKKDFPEEYGDKSYEDIFYTWRNSFVSPWPNLITEPDSEKVKVDDVKLRALVAVAELFLGQKLDGDETVVVLQWVADNVNEMSTLFTSPLNLDYEAIASAAHDAVQAEKDAAQTAAEGGEDGEVKGFGMRGDSAERVGKAIELLRGAVVKLDEHRKVVK